MTRTPAFAGVVFDCDSTLSTIEGIEHLAAALPPARRDEIHALTAAAMNGTVPLTDVYARRLEIVGPSRRDVERIGRAYVETLVSGAREVVTDLLAAGVRVGIVSGGLEPAVRHLAQALGIEDGDAVQAVPIAFDASGAYAGFDRASPLWQDGGKIGVLARLSVDWGRVLFVGDGVTDLEAQDVVALFAGFGGVVRREAVARGAEVYVETPDLGFVKDLVFPDA